MNMSNLDALLSSVLDQGGPHDAPDRIVDAALVRARMIPQRRPVVGFLDRQAWPAGRLTLGNGTVSRLATAVLVVLLIVALIAAAIGVGSYLLRTQQLRPSGWTSTSSMGEARYLPSATLLNDGTVLVAGGTNSATAVSNAEIYDPISKVWRRAGALRYVRGSYHTATVLSDGRVLVTGGGDARTATVELYDPVTNLWTAGTRMNEARSQHVAVRMDDGRVLVAGGTDGSAPALYAEVYDPGTETWTPTGPMAVWRASPAATLMGDGRVLVTGGFALSSFNDNDSAEVYDPGTNFWSAAGVMSVPRADTQVATLLPDERVLIAGGPGGVAELYDPSTNGWALTGLMIEGEGGHTQTLLADGTVLVAGGVDTNQTARSTSQLFDFRTELWTAIEPMQEARQGGSAVLLLDGMVVVVGGMNESGVELSSAELFGSLDQF